jgi:hypothetical protein
MIKPGQIYKSPNGYKVLITLVDFKDICSISNDGSCSVWDIKIGKIIEEGAILVAEYPTWQEAVNSKEFKE